MLYCGPVVLRTTLNESLYQHFLLLSVASTILSSKPLCDKFCSYADGLLKTFVRGFAELYGKTEVVYNVHGLLHLASDAQKFGCLENFSSFCFENKLKEIKKLVRKAHLPLQQIALRLAEREHASFRLVKKHVEGSYNFSKGHDKGPIPEGFENSKQFHKMETKGMCICVDQRDNCVQLYDRSVILVHNILQVGTRACVVYRKFTSVSDLFNYPLSSTSLGICRVSKLEMSLSCTDVENISHKCMILPMTHNSSDFAVMPLSHSYSCQF